MLNPMISSRARAPFVTLLILCALGTTLARSLPVRADSVELVSRVEPGSQSLTGGAASAVRYDPRGRTVSPEGRWVAFESSGVNLVPGQNDVSGTFDVFLSDRTTGETILVSRSAASPTQAGHGDSSAPVLSADGRYVAFLSTATDLVPGQTDSNEDTDVFLFDRVAGTTVLISHAAAGAATAGNFRSTAVTISADGGRIGFASQATDLIAGQSGWDTQVFLYDRASGVTVLVSHKAGSKTIAGNGDADPPALSADGALLTYVSRATDLVSGESDGNFDSDVFLYDQATDASILVSHANGLPAAANATSYLPVISSDGNTVAFTSSATNLVPGQSGSAAANIFLYARAGGAVTLVSHSSTGAARSGNAESYAPVLSADGGSVAFVSNAGDLIINQGPFFNGQVYLWRRSTGIMALASHTGQSPVQAANDESYGPELSADGAQLLFESQAQNLPAVHSDHYRAAYLYDRAAGTVSLVSRGPGSGSVDGFELSADGNTTVFASSSPEVTGDRNETYDVFRYARTTGVTTLVSQHPPGSPSLTPMAESSLVSLSDDGNYVAFLSRAGDLIPGEIDVTSFEQDLYLYSRPARTMTLVSHTTASPVTTGDHGVQDARISRDGGWVLFSSAAGNVVPGQTGSDGIWLFERATGNRILMNRSNGSPTAASPGVAQAGDLSIEGRWIAFSGFFTDLIPGQSTGFESNVFLFDRLSGATTLVSHVPGSAITGGNNFSAWTVPPVLSGNGRWIAFESEATNLVSGHGESTDRNVFFYDRDTGSVSLLSHAAGSSAAVWGNSPQISADGRYVAFQSNGLLPGETGTFSSDSLYLWDRVTGGLSLINHTASSPTQRPNGYTYETTSLSADGRFVVYYSRATNIFTGTFPPVDEPENVYLYDRTTGINTLVSHSSVSSTRAGNNPSYSPKISADGRFVTYTSKAMDLVAGQVSPYYTDNVFLWDRLADRTFLVSQKGNAVTGGDGNGPLAIGADGGAVAFLGGPLVPGDDNEKPDVYVFQHDLPGTDFFTLPPCRLLDTRQSGPAMASGVREVLTVHGACGIPATAWAVAVNITVVEPTGSGHLLFSPADATTSSSTLNFAAGRTRANNAVLRLALDATGALAVVPAVAGNGTVQVILDVTGYFE
jgi:Tol biopolymer transport system component